MAEPQTPEKEQKPKGVRVLGPDNRNYVFPAGTTKDKAITFFKSKGITSAESPRPKLGAPKAPKVPPGAVALPAEKPETTLQARGAEAATQALKWRPRWDTPEAILQDPTWYKRSLRYAGGELIGAGKAGLGVGVGGMKLLHDIASALDPFEGYNRPTGEPQAQVAKDVADIGRGIYDLGAATWDLVKHFPEASTDPEKLGNHIAQMAMVVDGAAKMAKDFAPMLKGDAKTAVDVAHRSTTAKIPSRFINRKNFQDVYRHTVGLDVAKKITRAAGEIDEEVRLHSNHLDEQIDTKVPAGTISAANEAQAVVDAVQSTIKTPMTEPIPPVLVQVMKDAKATAPNLWTFAKTRQLRSSIGRALGRVSGPQEAVLSKVYVDLTNKLKGVAKQYGLEDSWNHYNELERKRSRQFGHLIDKVVESQSGKEVAGHLLSDTGLTGELVNNLAKYRLDSKYVLDFMKNSARIAKDQQGWKGTLFRMAYGTPAGVPVMIAGRLAGAGWFGSVALGALAGYGFTGLVNAARALRLSPKVIQSILDARELPGKMRVKPGTFPEAGPGLIQEGAAPAAPAAPTAPTALPEPKKPPELPAPKIERRAESKEVGPRAKLVHPEQRTLYYRLKEQLKDKSLSERDRGIIEAQIKDIEEHPFGEKKLGYDIKSAKVEKKMTREEAEAASAKRHAAPPEAVGREPGARPGTTKESPLGRRTKARERVAKGREEAGRTRQKESEEAMARAQAMNMDVSQLQIPEMEEYLRAKSPSTFRSLQEQRKAKAFQESEYKEALMWYSIHALEGTEPE
jgi:hypothetical protein